MYNLLKNASKSQSLTINYLKQKKKNNEKITMITCYDKLSTQIADHSLIDTILVGDSLANVVLGYSKTAMVDIDTMLYYTKHVSEEAKRAIVIGDMPYGTYTTEDIAVKNALRFVQEGGVSMVKLEGCLPNHVKKICEHIPVVGHLGVQPQTAASFKAVGQTMKQANQIIEESLALEDAGASMLVLEKVTYEVAKEISQKLKIPTIGIGSGIDTDGQVLVWHDILGLGTGNKFKFAKEYAQTYNIMQNAVEQYGKEVENKEFPSKEHTFYMRPSEYLKFKQNSNNINIEKKVEKIEKTEKLEKIKNILVVGSGAMGSSISYFLNKNNNYNTTLYTNWEERAENIKQNGIQLNNASQNIKQEQQNELSVVTQIEDLQQNFYDLVIICRKSFDTSKNMKEIKSKLKQNSTVLSLQNGMQAEQELSKMFKKIVFGVTTCGMNIQENKVNFMMGKTSIIAHKKNQFQSQEEIEQIQEILNECNFNSQIVDNQQQFKKLKWTKLCINGAINSLATLYDIKNGDLKNPEFKKIISLIIEENLNIIRLQGIRITYEELEKEVYDTIEATPENICSTLQDFRKNRPQNEMQDILGSFIGQAHKLGFDGKVNQTLAEIIKNKQIHTINNNNLDQQQLNNNTIIIKKPKQLAQFRNSIQNRQVIFVPFLGGLHDGHIQLVKTAKKLNPDAMIICSLFLNKLQFQAESDFKTYPMNLNDDIELLKKHGVNVIFNPEHEDLYPSNNRQFASRVDFEGIEKVTGEGRSRPGFFKGIGTVVNKFFSYIRPDIAVFGQKDFQQIICIRRLIDEFHPLVKLHVEPTVRETDGLAMASRNKRLNEYQRNEAKQMYNLLMKIKTQFSQQGEKNAQKLIEIGHLYAKQNGIEIDYLTLCDWQTGSEVQGNLSDQNEHCVAVCVKIGENRLVDNIILEWQEQQTK